MPVIDKLEVRIPRGANFAREFGSLYSEVAHTPEFYKHFRTSQHYTQVADLRPFGYSSVLHFGNKHGKDGNHKLELIDTGRMGYSHMCSEIERVFEVNPESQDVMRADAAADIPNVPVEWFLRHARARYKQFADQHTKEMLVETMGKTEVQTLYFGKRPNCIRIYNKTAEYKHQYQQLNRSANPDSEIPEFKEVFGCEETAVLTRVERQMAGGRVPHKLTIVGTLRRHGREFNPFDKIEFINRSQMRPEPNPWDYKLKTYAAGMYFRQRIQEQGMHFFRAWVNKHSRRNADKIIKEFRDFLPCEELASERGVTELELFERYRDTFSAQMAA